MSLTKDECDSSHHVIEHAKTEMLLRLEQPVQGRHAVKSCILTFQNFVDHTMFFNVRARSHESVFSGLRLILLSNWPM